MELHSNDGNPLDEPAYHYQYITCPSYSTDQQLNDHQHADSLIDQTQAYILQSYPESENYSTTELINPDAEPHYQIGNYIANNIEYEVTDPGTTQIILHVDGTNGGQFYQQVYVNDNQTASTYHHYTMESADIEKQENELIHVIPSGHDSYEYSMLNSMDEHLPMDGHLQADHPLPPNDHELLHEKEQARILLESTMSPLLAAVNDITSRDENLQNYLAQTSLKNDMLANRIPSHQTNIYNSTEDEHIHHLNNMNPVPLHLTQMENQPTTTTTMTHTYSTNAKSNGGENEFVDINDMNFMEHRREMDHENLLVRRSQRKVKKDEELVICDKQVPYRSLCSLPTAYLYINGNGDNDVKVFAKKEIPLRTKFGPVEGDMQHIIDPDHLKKHSTLPLYLIDESTYIDTSNELTSNWMRFVKLAVKISEQNCLLYECDGRLYFRTCKFIHPKQELKVGYSKEYADRFGLNFLVPDDNEVVSDQEKWPCFECESKFESFDLLQNHLMNEHDDDPANGDGNKKVKAKRRKIRSKLSSRKVSGPTTVAACCYCSKVFSKLISLKRHTEYTHSFADTESRATTSANNENGGKSFKCELCRRYFTSAERFDKHRLIHCTTAKDTSSLKCTFCPRRLLTPSALSMHIKTHIYKNRLFHCLFCPERFQWANEIMNHVPVHRVDGFYSCEHCKKKFKEYSMVRKHVRSYHSSILHSCSDCGAKFKSVSKLKIHRLRHSDVKEFLCSQCGKQFKRKDKLREHQIAKHSEAAENAKKNQSIDQRSAQPDVVVKIAPPDYDRFIYKCHHCLLGFKRRGMLINHMAKRHPKISIDTVPELNLPILKPQRFFYCVYCEKVYKSSSKRKNHILKYHPGEDLPQSARSKMSSEGENQNLSYSEVVGSVTLSPQRCLWCHKQYATRTRLLLHQRKSHSDNLNAIAMGARLNELDDGKPNFIPHETEPENKLLKLSSAALEASLKDDFHFLDDNSSALSKIDVNFKVVGEFVDSSSGSNVDVQRLPQLFEGIDCLNLKPRDNEET
ncbi:PR domain zinc finger protein 10-like [Bradysia coprophila]|uniref:PR domain zinc finger protein 10-like n=1 Tax=Bradysia coprophila TaxID=38358 RepID=UPI00187DBD6A|nr:PR domain zinc finger protein 10-like [Bradysia coprophila]